MKGIISVLLLLATVLLPAAAQEREGDRYLSDDDNEGYAPLADDDEEQYLNGIIPVATFSPEAVSLPDSLHLATTYRPVMRYPYRWAAPTFGGYGTWWLHEGFNASLDLSAFTSFGKGHISGIAEQINVAYVHSVDDHFSFAIGGYFSNVNTNSGAYRAAGIAALLNYRFNEHWETFLYAQKNLLNSVPASRYGRWNSMYPYDYFGDLSDRIGLGVRYNFNESTFVEIRFDVERTPNFFPQHPLPPSATDNPSSPTTPPAARTAPPSTTPVPTISAAARR